MKEKHLVGMHMRGGLDQEISDYIDLSRKVALVKYST